MALQNSGINKLASSTCKFCKFDFLPIKRSFKNYSREKAAADLKAGLNVALLAFPQSMAYAVIAGLPIFYGLFTEIVAGIVGPIFSGSRLLIAGSTNATAVLFFATIITLGLTPEHMLAIVPLLLFMVGVFLIVGSLIGVANFIQFISRSVITGYITAAAFYIIVNQTSKVFGVHVDLSGGFTLFGLAWKTMLAIPHSNPPTLLLSGVTAGCYWLMQKHFPKLPNVAIVLVLMSALGVVFNDAIAHSLMAAAWVPIAHLDAVSVSSWKLHVPHFNLADINLIAQTALVIAFLCTLEAASVGKSVAARAGEKFDAVPEIMGVGAANIASAFWGGMPVSGSPVRSQLNWSSGAHTALAPIISSLFVAVGVFFIGAGVFHFVRPAPYLAMMPPWLPQPNILVAVSGLAEIAGGIGVLLGRFRRLAAWGLIALLVAVFPANLHVALHGWPGMDFPRWVLWVRLPFQVLFIWLVYYFCLAPGTRRAAEQAEVEWPDAP